MVVFENVSQESIKKLLTKGFLRDEIKSAYEDARLRKGRVVLVFYASGKLLVQGNPQEAESIVRILEKMKIGVKTVSSSFKKEKGTIIGSDESLKGDTFGGLVVAAVKADDAGREQLISIGTADSKTLNDQEIPIIAEKIRSIASCEVRSLLPEEYNHYDGNVTALLNKLHQECAQYLAPGRHVIDKYPGCAVGNVIEEKADAKYAEVAAASILARDAALKQLDYLSVLAGFPLPKGSTHVKLALHELRERKLDFQKFVKINFQNVQEFLKTSP